MGMFGHGKGTCSMLRLTPVDEALDLLLDGLAPVAPRPLELARAIGCIAAEMLSLATPLPPAHVAMIDGWAVDSLAIAGASPYGPVTITPPPVRVAAGMPLPPGTDAILRAEWVTRMGPHHMAIAAAHPGEGVRRTGEDMAAGRPLLFPGRRITPADALVLATLGETSAPVRRPRVAVINVGAPPRADVTARFIARLVADEGAEVHATDCPAEASRLAEMLGDTDVDLVLTIGATGDGEDDVVGAALAAIATDHRHGLALAPGETTATARLGARPVICLPGLPDQALGACLALARPVIRHLAGALPPRHVTLPLRHKLTSRPGVAELVLLARDAASWRPLAIGAFPLDHIRLADAWSLIPPESEGAPPDTPFAAAPLFPGFPAPQAPE